MKKVKQKLTAMLNAVTFAEAGEREAAIDFLEQDSRNHEALNAGETAPPRSVASLGRNLIRRLEDHMVAATFGEAGELETAREVLLTEERPKAVLLVMDGQPNDSDAFTYALHLCKRIQAEMEILAFAPGLRETPDGKDPSNKSPQFERATVLSRRAAERGVPCSVTMHAGNLDDCLFDYVRLHKEITAVIYGSHGKRKASGGEPGLRRALEAIVAKLAIPFVTVLRKGPVGAHS